MSPSPIAPRPGRFVELGPGTRATRLIRLGLGMLVLVVSASQILIVATSFPVSLDLLIPLKAAERWLAGGQPYLTDGFSDPSALAPFLYPPFVLPFLAPLTALPEIIVRWAWLGAGILAGVFVCRRMAVPWRLVPVVLAWPPFAGGIWGGNLQVFLVAAFVAAFWSRPTRADLHPCPRDLDGSEQTSWTVGWLAAAVGAVKISQGLAWLVVLRHRPRVAVIGALPWVLIVGVTIPVTGISLYGTWVDQVVRASDPSWPMMGVSLLAYLPSGVVAVLTVAAIVAAWRLRGPELGAWLALIMLLISPNMHDFTGLFLLPALLLIRREVALLAALLTASYTAQGWWLGIALVVGAMLLGRVWPILREPVLTT